MRTLKIWQLTHMNGFGRCYSYLIFSHHYSRDLVLKSERNRSRIMLNYIRITLLTIFVSSLLSTYSYGQKPPIRVFGYFDLVAKDFLNREFPNGSQEDPPPTFSLLRTHILFSSRFSEDWRSLINIRFQNGLTGVSFEHSRKIFPPAATQPTLSRTSPSRC